MFWMLVFSKKIAIFVEVSIVIGPAIGRPQLDSGNGRRQSRLRTMGIVPPNMLVGEYSYSHRKILLDWLAKKAQGNPCLRMNMDLRDTTEDQSQRMLNAIEPGTVIPIHRQTQTSEEVVILRGRAEEVLYDNNGKEIGRYLLVPGSDTPAIHVPMGQYHTCEFYEQV